MNAKKLIALLLALVMVVGLLTACGGGEEETTTAAPQGETTQGNEGGETTSELVVNEGIKIGLSQQHLTNDFNRGILEGATAMAKQLGAELITANAQGDSNQQVADMENFLTMGVDAVIIGGGEAPAFAEVINKMNEANIPIITIDMTRDSRTVCNLTSDNFNGGEQLSLYVANKLGGVGNILILDTPGWHSIEIRVRMLEEVVSDFPELNIAQTISIGTQDAVNNYAKETKAYLQGNPDIQCIFADWGLAAVGASQALREMGLTDEIFVVTIDADMVVMEEMMKEDSPLTAVVGQYPSLMGAGAVENACKAVTGGYEIPGEIYIPIILTEKTDASAWFSAPQIMTPQEAWDTLYGEGAAAPTSDLDASGIKIGLSQQHLTNDFNRGILEGAKAMAEEIGAELITANAQGDSNQQVADMENFLTMGVDAVIIGGGEAPAFAEVINKMNEAGIPIITIDMTRDSRTVCNLTSDNFNGGEQLSLYVANKLGGVGNILILDTPGWHSIEIRVRMLNQIVSDFPELNIAQTISIGTQDAVNNYAKETKAYLQGNPDIQCIFADWGLAAVGASQALREMGLTDEIFVVTIDADMVVMEEMMKEDSPLTAVVGQYPSLMGSGAVENAAKAVLGGYEIPGEIYIPIILTEKTDPNAWFSAPQIMTPQEAWDALYGE